MSLYYFAVHDGRLALDAVGVDFPDLGEARLAAIEYAGEILREEARHFWDTQDWRLDVRDEGGLVLFSVIVSAFDAPALARRRP